MVGRVWSDCVDLVVVVLGDWVVMNGDTNEVLALSAIARSRHRVDLAQLSLDLASVGDANGDGDGVTAWTSPCWVGAPICFAGLGLGFIGWLAKTEFGSIGLWIRFWDPGDFCINVWDPRRVSCRLSTVSFFWDQYPRGIVRLISLRMSTSLLLDSAKKVYCQSLFSLLSHVLT